MNRTALLVLALIAVCAAGAALALLFQDGPPTLGLYGRNLALFLPAQAGTLWWVFTRRRACCGTRPRQADD